MSNLKDKMNTAGYDSELRDIIFYKLSSSNQLNFTEKKNFVKTMLRRRKKMKRIFVNLTQENKQNVILELIHEDNKNYIIRFENECQQFINELIDYELDETKNLNIKDFHYEQDEILFSEEGSYNRYEKSLSLFLDCVESMYRYASTDEARELKLVKYTKFKQLKDMFKSIKNIYLNNKKYDSYSKLVDSYFNSSDKVNEVMNEVIDLFNKTTSKQNKDRYHKKAKDLFCILYPELIDFFDFNNLYNYSFNGIFNDLQVIIALITIYADRYDGLSKTDNRNIHNNEEDSTYKFFEGLTADYLFSDDIGGLFVEVKYYDDCLYIMTQKDVKTFPSRIENRLYKFNDIGEMLDSLELKVQY